MRFGYIGSRWILGLYGEFISVNFNTVLHSNCANSHSHQQYVRVPLSSHPCRHLLLSVCWIIAIVIYLVMILQRIDQNKF